MAITNPLKRKTPRTDLDEQLAVLAQWQERRATADRALTALREGMGERALDDPEAAALIPAQIAELGNQLEVANQAIAAVTPRVDRARHAVLMEEAALLDPAVDKARGRLTDYLKRRDKMHAALEDFTGDRYELVEKLPQGVTSMPAPRQVENRLREELRAAEVLPAIIRDVANGGTGMEASTLIGGGRLPVDQWPAVVAGPDAVLLAPYWVEATAYPQAPAPVALNSWSPAPGMAPSLPKTFV